MDGEEEGRMGSLGWADWSTGHGVPLAGRRGTGALD